MSRSPSRGGRNRAGSDASSRYHRSGSSPVRRRVRVSTSRHLCIPSPGLPAVDALRCRPYYSYGVSMLRTCLFQGVTEVAVAEFLAVQRPRYGGGRWQPVRMRRMRLTPVPKSRVPGGKPVLHLGLHLLVSSADRLDIRALPQGRALIVHAVTSDDSASTQQHRQYHQQGGLQSLTVAGYRGQRRTPRRGRLRRRQRTPERGHRSRHSPRRLPGLRDGPNHRSLTGLPECPAEAAA